VIPPDRVDLLEPALEHLRTFGASPGVRGRFIALYLGLRRMGDEMPRLGSGNHVTTGELEQHLDELYTKTHRPEPYVVLTAPFGGSYSENAPYSTRTGVVAPGHSYPTNTWRNNFGIQKGIGCPAEPAVIADLIQRPLMRLACPHMEEDPEGQHVCGIAEASYRGEEHAIWLRRINGGVQSVDLTVTNVYQGYLMPDGARIPIFPLIAMLYCAAPVSAYPAHATVGIPDFAQDFNFSLAEVERIFDCQPESEANAQLLALLDVAVAPPPALPPVPAGDETANAEDLAAAIPLPELAPAGQINSGVGAEIAVANELIANGWAVTYRGNPRGLGYDLEATRSQETMRVEVKSSFGFTYPELLDSEWEAAQQHGAEYVLAVVDFYGSEEQRSWYVRDPAGAAVPIERTTTIYRFVREDIASLATDVDVL
jgi:hypothetical protein